MPTTAIEPCRVWWTDSQTPGSVWACCAAGTLATVAENRDHTGPA